MQSGYETRMFDALATPDASQLRIGSCFQAEDWNGHARRSGNAFRVAQERGDTTTDCRVDNLGPTLGTDPCRDILEDEEFPTNPKVLRDGLRVHGGLTDITCAIVTGIRHGVCHSYSKA